MSLGWGSALADMALADMEGRDAGMDMAHTADTAEKVETEGRVGTEGREGTEDRAAYCSIPRNGGAPEGARSYAAGLP